MPRLERNQLDLSSQSPPSGRTAEILIRKTLRAGVALVGAAALTVTLTACGSSEKEATEGSGKESTTSETKNAPANSGALITKVTQTKVGEALTGLDTPVTSPDSNYIGNLSTGAIYVANGDKISEASINAKKYVEKDVEGVFRISPNYVVYAVDAVNNENSLHAFSMKDGKEVDLKELKVEPIAKEGNYLCADKYLVSLAETELVAIDLSTGKQVASMKDIDGYHTIDTTNTSYVKGPVFGPVQKADGSLEAIDLTTGKTQKVAEDHLFYPLADGYVTASPFISEELSDTDKVEVFGPSFQKLGEYNYTDNSLYLSGMPTAKQVNDAMKALEQAHKGDPHWGVMVSSAGNILGDVSEGGMKTEAFGEVPIKVEEVGPPWALLDGGNQMVAFNGSEVEVYAKGKQDAAVKIAGDQMMRFRSGFLIEQDSKFHILR